MSKNSKMRSDNTITKLNNFDESLITMKDTKFFALTTLSAIAKENKCHNFSQRSCIF